MPTAELLLPQKGGCPNIQKKFVSRIDFANGNRPERVGIVREELVKPHKCFRSECDTQQGSLCSRGFLLVEWGDWKFWDMVWKVHERGVDDRVSQWRDDIMDVRSDGCWKVAAQYPVDNLNHSG